MSIYGGWEAFGEQLGKGGQGTVYRARSPQLVAERAEALKRIGDDLRNFDNRSPDLQTQLLQRIVKMGAADSIEMLGALKIYELPAAPGRRENAITRLRAEIEGLRKIEHPSALRLLEASHLGIDNPFIVTQLHPNGTLDGCLERYKGRALEALKALRQITEVVGEIHKLGGVHRDIKPKNIFLANDGRLVLGDFGIVIFRTDDRVTETYERVGSRDWMAPWANEYRRLEDNEVNATLDLFPLGKVLWCMISGRAYLPFWYYDRPASGQTPANNLAHLFPGDPAMTVVNEVLANCVVEHEGDCVPSAEQLLALIDEAIERIEHLGRRPSAGGTWFCGACGVGHYNSGDGEWMDLNIVDKQGMPGHNKATVNVCDNCGHIQLFLKNPSEFRRPNPRPYLPAGVKGADS